MRPWRSAPSCVNARAAITDFPVRLNGNAPAELARKRFHCGATLISELANFKAAPTYGAATTGDFLFREQTSPVDQFPANCWGLLDLHGNIYE